MPGIVRVIPCTGAMATTCKVAVNGCTATGVGVGGTGVGVGGMGVGVGGTGVGVGGIGVGVGVGSARAHPNAIIPITIRTKSTLHDSLNMFFFLLSSSPGKLDPRQ
jgi:hypothetical protein